MSDKPEVQLWVTAVRKRFYDKTEAGSNGCLVWTANSRRNRSGFPYGQFYFRGRNREAHRVAYELNVGPIPEGLTIDHLCRNTLCVNAGHLEVVTRRENVLRGDTLPAANLKKTHCPHGHPYSGSNLIVKTTGARGCRTCKVLRDRAYYKQKREENHVQR